MSKSVQLGPPYSTFFISDVSLEGELEPSRKHLNWSATTVQIGCAYCYEKDTTVTIGLWDEVALPREPVFDGEIETPNRKVAVSTAHLDIVLEHDVPDTVTRITIWENHPVEPDEIVIAVE